MTTAITTHREFLPAALEILDTPPNPAGRAVMATISAALVVAVVWSSLGQIDIVATAPGSVIPAGKSKIVQPLEAGVLRAIRVEDGDHVTAGQILFELDQTVSAADRDRIARDWRQARLDAAGLRALSADLSGGGFDPAGFIAPDGIPAPEIAIARAGIEARAREQAQKCQSLDQQIAQKDAEAAENNAMVAKLAATLPLLQQKRDLYRALLNIAFTSKVAWLDSEHAYTDQLHQLAVQQSHAGGIVASRAALVAQLSQTRAGYAHDVLKDLAEAEQKDGGPVLVEATVDNGDIGFVHAGQDVEVKVRTFEFTRYGLLHGHVVDVSRDRMAEAASSGSSRAAREPTAEDGKPNETGYVAHVALDSARMVVDGREEALSPGMSVTTEIKTGRRSVISYLLSPLRRYAHEGIRER